MKAEIAVMTAENIDRKAIARGGEILKNGGLVAFPTETVYGLGGNALDPKASMKIYAAKGRPSDNPLIVHIADIRDLDKIVTEVPEKARILAEKYWPRSEEHTSELQSPVRISYAVFCLKKKNAPT